MIIFETIAALAAMILSQKFCGDFVVRQHLNWELHIKMLLQEEQFKTMYHMSHSSFKKLLIMLLP
jgi:hypothetical protein